MKKLIHVFCLCLIALTLSNCATIVRGTTQEITTNTTPAGARVLVNGEDRGLTPTTLTLKRNRAHQIVFQLAGHDDLTVNIDREFKIVPTIIGNLFSFAIIGVIVDISNGSAYQLTPEQLNVTLRSLSASVDLETGDDEIRVVFFSPDQIRAALALEAAE